MAYVGKKTGGEYDPFLFGVSMGAQEVEISDDVFVITAEAAQAYREARTATTPAPGVGPLFSEVEGRGVAIEGGAGGGRPSTAAEGDDLPAAGPDQPKSLRWTGDVPPQKWMNFYTKVLSRFVAGKGPRLGISVDLSPEGGVSNQTIQETKTALRELGLQDDVRVRGTVNRPAPLP